MSKTFDALAATRQLHRAGIEQPHAEAVADVVRDSRDGLATQDGMDALSSRIDGVNGRIDGLKSLIDGVNDRIDGVNGRIDGLKSLIDALNERIETLRGELSTIRWVLGLIAAMVMALLVITLTRTF